MSEMWYQYIWCKSNGGSPELITTCESMRCIVVDLNNMDDLRTGQADDVVVFTCSSVVIKGT